MARKHVTPAYPGASVPDPIHGGYLPSAGIDVEFTGYWALLALRGDIIVGDPLVPGPGDPPPGPPIQPGDALLVRRGGIEVLLPVTDLLNTLRETSETLTVASDGTLSPLSHTPNGNRVSLNIGGFVFRSFGTAPVISVDGTTVIWNAANAPNGASLDPSDIPIATYTY